MRENKKTKQSNTQYEKPNPDFTSIIIKIIKIIRKRNFVSIIIIIIIMNEKYIRLNLHCIDLYVEIKFNEMIYGFEYYRRLHI